MTKNPDVLGWKANESWMKLLAHFRLSVRASNSSEQWKEEAWVQSCYGPKPLSLSWLLLYFCFQLIYYTLLYNWGSGAGSQQHHLPNQFLLFFNLLSFLALLNMKRTKTTIKRLEANYTFHFTKSSAIFFCSKLTSTLSPLYKVRPWALWEAQFYCM